MAYEILRQGDRMKDLCDCRPEDMDIEDQEPNLEFGEDGDENLMQRELERVFFGEKRNDMVGEPTHDDKATIDCIHQGK